MLTAIKGAKTAVVVAHVNPDGDTLGSMLAVAKVLEKAGLERIDRVMHDKVPEIYKFFPDSDKVLCSTDPEDQKKLLENYDISFSCDCGSTKRLGSAADFWSKAKQTGNIDHHLSNTLFADLNWVEPDATSTGQVVGHLANKLGVDIDVDLASLMYITLLTDTGGFRHSNSNAQAFKWASELIEQGADASKLYNALFNKMPFKTIKVIGDALNKLELHEFETKSFGKIKLAYTETFRSFLNELDADDEDTDEIVDHIMRAKDLDMCLYLREGHREGMIKGSFRSSRDDIDCSKLAGQLNGGGHARAAGFNLDGTLEEIKNKTIDLIKNQQH